LNRDKAAGAVAVASILLLGGRRIPVRRRHVVLWCGGKASSRAEEPPVAKMLRELGVDIDVHRYTTTVTYVSGLRIVRKRYARWKIVVRDEEILKILNKMGQDTEFAKKLFKRYEGVFRRVLKSLGRTGKTSKAIRQLAKYLTIKDLREMLGMTPFIEEEYLKLRNRLLVKALKPNWRGWLYQRVIHASNTKSNTEYSD